MCDSIIQRCWTRFDIEVKADNTNKPHRKTGRLFNSDGNRWMLAHIKGGGGDVVKRKEEKQMMQTWKGRADELMSTKKLPREALAVCYWVLLE